MLVSKARARMHAITSQIFAYLVPFALRYGILWNYPCWIRRRIRLSEGWTRTMAAGSFHGLCSPPVRRQLLTDYL